MGSAATKVALRGHLFNPLARAADIASDLAANGYREGGFALLCAALESDWNAAGRPRGSRMNWARPLSSGEMPMTRGLSGRNWYGWTASAADDCLVMTRNSRSGSVQSALFSAALYAFSRAHAASLGYNARTQILGANSICWTLRTNGHGPDDQTLTRINADISRYLKTLGADYEMRLACEKNTAAGA